MADQARASNVAARYKPLAFPAPSCILPYFLFFPRHRFIPICLSDTIFNHSSSTMVVASSASEILLKPNRVTFLDGDKSTYPFLKAPLLTTNSTSIQRIVYSRLGQTRSSLRGSHTRTLALPSCLLTVFRELGHHSHAAGVEFPKGQPKDYIES
ncbi:hypothetical protein E1B28_007046 [Marasmius oreades]|uniref:Uncharacterized protein n=1 Tax=Marasmius oreades TaxID=181124 RepID=A0A9P7UVI0_9AGAR|nr:uncharacterized protein E1B28_007046 [Marasmius oreades]KAG7093364.1 hypothetical protein E1B28_007046 [Marasmius oreades]